MTDIKYEKTSMCETLDSYAAKKGLSDLSTALAIHETYKEYVLYNEHGVLYASQQAEAISAKIDMLFLAKKFFGNSG